jgi:hypothetical protein
MKQVASSSTSIRSEHVPPRHWLTFNGLHDMISQKIELSTDILIDDGYFIDLSYFCFVLYITRAI